MKKWTVDILYWLGAGLISAGCWLWSPIAGLLAGGAFCIAASVLSENGGEGGGRA